MIKEYLSDKKIVAVDRPHKIVFMAMGLLAAVFLNIWGIGLCMICASIYSQDEDMRTINRLIPEKTEHRKKRLICGAVTESTFMTVAIAVNCMIMVNWKSINTGGFSVSVGLTIAEIYVILLNTTLTSAKYKCSYFELLKYRFRASKKSVYHWVSALAYISIVGNIWYILLSVFFFGTDNKIIGNLIADREELTHSLSENFYRIVIVVAMFVVMIVEMFKDEKNAYSIDGLSNNEETKITAARK